MQNVFSELNDNLGQLHFTNLLKFNHHVKLIVLHFSILIHPCFEILTLSA